MIAAIGLVAKMRRRHHSQALAIFFDTVSIYGIRCPKTTMLKQPWSPEPKQRRTGTDQGVGTTPGRLSHHIKPRRRIMVFLRLNNGKITVD